MIEILKQILWGTSSWVVVQDNDHSTDIYAIPAEMVTSTDKVLTPPARRKIAAKWARHIKGAWARGVVWPNRVPSA